MPYLPELTPYTHSRKPKCGEFDVVSVGWLDEKHTYSQGKMDIGYWSKFKKILASQGSIHLTRGKHLCGFCRQASGNGEYHTYNPRTNRIYIAPALIQHYVQAHHYAPPEEFIEAVLHKLLNEGDCSEIDGLYEALNFGMQEDLVQVRVRQILGI